jgi:hypothetical protein
MNKDQKREALEWLVNDTDPANYIGVEFEGGKFRKRSISPKPCSSN